MNERRLIGYRVKKGSVWIVDCRNQCWIFAFVDKSKAIVFVNRRLLYRCLSDLALDESNYPMGDMSDVKVVRVYKRAKR
jgi:hypothetical protein